MVIMAAQPRPTERPIHLSHPCEERLSILSRGIDHREKWEPVKIGVARAYLPDSVLAH